MRIIYNNYINDISSGIGSITASSALLNYEVDHIQNDRLTYSWKSDSTTTQTILFDFGEAKSITTIAIVGHNIINSASIIFEANIKNSWSQPAISQTVQWNENVILYFFSAAQNYRYWRLVITGQGNIEIGKVVLGTYLTINPSSLLDFKVIEMNDDSVFYGKNRQKIAYNGDKWRKIILNFPKTEYAMINSIETMFDAVGNFRSIIFCNFDTIRDYPIVEPLYCSIVGDLSFMHKRNMAFEYSLVLEEDL